MRRGYRPGQLAGRRLLRHVPPSGQGRRAHQMPPLRRPPTPSPCTGSLAAAAATSVSSRALTAAASESCAAAALAAATVSCAALALAAAAIPSGLSPSALFAAGTAHAAADVAAVAAPPVALSSVKHISRWNGSFVCNALATRLFPQSHSHPNCCQSGGFNEPSAQAPAQVIAHVLTQIAKQMLGWSTAFPTITTRPRWCEHAQCGDDGTCAR